MKIARQPRILASTPMNGMHPFPAPSLRELSRPTGVTEGVSSDGSSMPTVYTPAHINSVTFERLRSPKYTPSASHSLSSSLREGAGNGPYHSSHHPKTATFRAIFIAPTQLKRFGFLPFIERHSLSQPFGLPAPSEREPGTGRTIHPTTQKPQHFGRFSSPLRKLRSFCISPYNRPLKNFRFPPG